MYAKLETFLCNGTFRSDIYWVTFMSDINAAKYKRWKIHVISYRDVNRHTVNWMQKKNILVGGHRKTCQNVNNEGTQVLEYVNVKLFSQCSVRILEIKIFITNYLTPAGGVPIFYN